MFTLSSNDRFRLYSEPTDMRKSFNGLSGLVLNKMKQNVVSGDVFIFINKSRNMMKLLRWEKGGFVLFIKRLEQGTFKIPTIDSDMDKSIEWTDLVLMVEGVVIKQYKMQKRYVM
ncbi:IS66 family insertion sequence element accessory protein TnpB [Halosquirtibacter xylanolyticus]|uniref:IS66 family insertion sequence element accessory protein TnpB n=1 Tax=Halosquirtibacter xylanolyticus TaxID=3374599 RepID=UPI00374A4756|nr:IS66 family insertion sequence element accessory protein TnpB [Prolixibacteraceae bacterium]QZT37624.1 IS66 family insertion sequence element accessory protein TnpB [Prolixibacteraceae bacterium]